MNNPKLIRDGRKFQQDYVAVKELAAGSEGRVTLWKQRTNGQLVAVKVPVSTSPFNLSALKSEAQSISILGRHPHVVQFLGSADNWSKDIPALFYEYCDLGDVSTYQHSFFATAGKVVPELTIWKFMTDMTKALDYLHNGLQISYVHGDLKPHNILVRRRPDDDSKRPLMPIFKLADLSHLKPYMRRKNTTFHYMFHGTWEYAPPMEERKAQLAPPVDIWALGASIQMLAWGILPVKSSEVVRRELLAEKKFDPPTAYVHRHQMREEYRSAQEFIWRPLNSTGEDKIAKYDMQYDFAPHSDQINDWYAMCLKKDPKARVSSKILKKYYLPIAEKQMDVLTAKMLRTVAMNKLKQLEARVEQCQEQRASLPMQPPVKQTGARNAIARKPVAEKREPRQNAVNVKKKALRNV